MCLNRQIVNISSPLLPVHGTCTLPLHWVAPDFEFLDGKRLDSIAHAMNIETGVFRELLDSCLNCAMVALQLVNLSSSVTLIADNPSSGEFN